MRSIGRFLVSVFMLLYPFILFASEGHEASHHFDPRMELFRLVNFLVFLFLLYKFAGKSLKNFFGSRVENIKRGLEEAEKAYTSALSKYDEAKAVLAKMDEEVRAIYDRARLEAEEQSRRIKEETERMIERLREQAKSACDLEIKRAKKELEKEVADLAVTLAKEILVKNISDEDHRRLLQEYVNKVREVH